CSVGGPALVSASGANPAGLWDPKTGKLLVQLNGHTGTVDQVVFSPDGTRLVTASQDRTVRVWDPETGKQLAVFEGHAGRVLRVAFGTDGANLLSVDERGTLRWHVTREVPALEEARRRLWREQQAESAERARLWVTAAYHLDRLIAQRPREAPLYLRRGHAHAEQAKWQQALDDFAQAGKFDPGDYLPAYWRGVALLGRGDEAGYRAACQELLQRFS